MAQVSTLMPSGSWEVIRWESWDMLPAEIRSNILQHLVPVDRVFEMGTTANLNDPLGPEPPKRLTSAKVPGRIIYCHTDFEFDGDLLKVSKGFAGECLEILYGANRFSFSGYIAIKWFTDMMSPRNLQRIQKVEYVPRVQGYFMDINGFEYFVSSGEFTRNFVNLRMLHLLYIGRGCTVVWGHPPQLLGAHHCEDVVGWDEQQYKIVDLLSALPSGLRGVGVLCAPQHRETWICHDVYRQEIDDEELVEVDMGGIGHQEMRWPNAESWVQEHQQMKRELVAAVAATADEE